MNETDVTDGGVKCPFNVLIDSAEQLPWRFTGISVDKGEWPPVVQVMIDQEKLFPWQIVYNIDVTHCSLGHHHGDYSIQGYEGRVHIERKSLEDAIATFCAYADREVNFQKEMEYLHEVEYSAVVVECSVGQALANVRQWGTKTEAQNRQRLSRKILSLQMDYNVQWFWCDSRRHAEITTFRLLNRFYRKLKDES
jgi:ERCC4-type nuclease